MNELNGQTDLHLTLAAKVRRDKEGFHKERVALAYETQILKLFNEMNWDVQFISVIPTEVVPDGS